MSLDSDNRFDTPRTALTSVPALGRCVISQDGHTAVLAPGEFAVLDASRPYDLSVEGVRWVLVAAAPAELADSRPDERSRIAVTRTGTHPVRMPDGRPSAVRPLNPQSDLLARIHRYMEDQLTDPHLCARTIAVAHHISTRYLHKLFQTQATTVNAWIRDRRLAACKRELADPRCGHRSIGAIGARWNLAPASYFSRVFKETYGCTPSQVRAVAGMPDNRSESPLRRTG
jgi:AraC-like DNA-binding protein